MSIGNLKDSGNLNGNNFPWQLKMLLGQQCACDELIAINANTDNVEFLLTSILNTLQASTEYEAKFVIDTCNANTVYLEVRVWNPDTSTWGPITYYLPGSDTPVVPPGASTPGCLQYTDPSSVLGLILAELQAQSITLTDIESDTSVVATALTAVNRTPGLIRATGAGTIPAGARSISVYNAGNAAGSVLGVAGNILPGEILNYSAGGQSDVLTAFAYDGTGTTLVITTIV